MRVPIHKRAPVSEADRPDAHERRLEGAMLPGPQHANLACEPEWFAWFPRERACDDSVASAAS